MNSDFKERLALDAEKWRRVRETEECQIQAKLFKSWLTLGAVNYAEIEDGIGLVWCPVHERLERIQLECGLSPIEAANLLAEKIPEHAKEVTRVRKQIEKEMNL